MKKKAIQEAKAQAKLEKANSKRSAQEVEEFEHSDVSCHGGKKQPSDDSTYSEDSDSGSDTTVELQPRSPSPYSFCICCTFGSCFWIFWYGQ